MLVNHDIQVHNNIQQYDNHDDNENFHGNLRNEYTHEDIDEDAVEIAIATEIFQIHEHTANNNKSLFLDDDDSNVIGTYQNNTIHLDDINDKCHEVDGHRRCS